MILPNSRYANSTVATLEAPAAFGGGDVAVIVPSPASSYNFAFINHQVVHGERIDSIAFQYYTDPALWWRIAQANPEIMYWDNLPVGTILRIPQI